MVIAIILHLSCPMLSWLSCCSETDQITAGFHHWLRVDGGLCHQQRHGHRQQRQAGLARYPWLLATYYLIIMCTIYSLIYIYIRRRWWWWWWYIAYGLWYITWFIYIYDLREIMWTCVHMYDYVCVYIYVYVYIYIYVYYVIIYSSFFLSFFLDLFMWYFRDMMDMVFM